MKIVNILGRLSAVLILGCHWIPRCVETWPLQVYCDSRIECMTYFTERVPKLWYLITFFDAAKAITDFRPQLGGPDERDIPTEIGIMCAVKLGGKNAGEKIQFLKELATCVRAELGEGKATDSCAIKLGVDEKKYDSCRLTDEGRKMSEAAVKLRLDLFIQNYPAVVARQNKLVYYS